MFSSNIFTPENLVAGVVVVGLILYTVFGGADFGSGIWTLLASGPRARQQRESLFNAIGPIWETNHVWLIFVVVTLFTNFPTGFRDLFIALLIPFVIALIGINFRGAAFAFRHFGRQTRAHLPATGLVFSMSSALTPLALGMAVTATAAGHIIINNGQVQAGLWSAWITPFTIVGGLVGLALCAFLTPTYMTVRTQGDLQDDFRKRGIAAALALGVLTTLEVVVGLFFASRFTAQLFRPLPLVFVALASIFGIITILLLWSRRFLWSQYSAAGTVACVLIGFGLAMYPYLIINQLTIAQAAAPRATLIAFLTILPFGIVILVPSLILLYRTFLAEPV